MVHGAHGPMVLWSCFQTLNNVGIQNPPSFLVGYSKGLPSYRIGFTCFDILELVRRNAQCTQAKQTSIQGQL